MTNPSEHETPDSNESSVGSEGVENAPSVPVELDFGGEPGPTAAIDSSAEIEKWKDVAARATADLDNFRKRMAREKFEAIQYANRGLLEQLLPIIDNFEMGLKAAESLEGSGSIILQGMSMVRKQLEDFLGEQGVEIVASDGVAFDPNLHEALKQENHASAPEGQVLYTMRRGYRLKDRLLRAANVVVSAGPGTES